MVVVDAEYGACCLCCKHERGTKAPTVVVVPPVVFMLGTARRTELPTKIADKELILNCILVCVFSVFI